MSLIPSTRPATISSLMKKKMRIGTRGSLLAKWQAAFVKARLEKQNPNVEIDISIIQTSADQRPDVPLQELGSKAVFVKELETALLANKIDVAVHSLKDMAANPKASLAIQAYIGGFRRQDAYIHPKNTPFLDLPPETLIGSSSLRRVYQMKQLIKNLQYVPMRGNVDTRLKKCKEGVVQAILLAAAGLDRLEYQKHITSLFSIKEMVPAGGQGILAVQTRKNDTETATPIQALNDYASERAATVEFGFLKVIQADCHTPVGVFAIPHEDKVSAEVFYADATGTNWIRFSQENMSGTSTEIANELGKIADQLWQQKTGKNMTASLCHE